MGLQMTNRVKAPILLYSMGKKDEAIDFATKKLDEVRPSKKNKLIEEPKDFKSVDEAWSFFRRDKDPRYYYNYLQFYNRFKIYVANH